MLRNLNHKFISFACFVSPAAINRPGDEVVYSTVCVERRFALERSKAQTAEALQAFVEMLEIDVNNLAKTKVDATKFVVDAMNAGSLAFVDMPMASRYEGQFIPENRPDGAVAAIVRYKELDALEENAKRQINNYLFDEDEAPFPNEEADSVIHAKYPQLSYPEILDAISDFVDEFERNKDCNVAENDTWQNSVKDVLNTLSRAKSSKRNPVI